MVGGVWVAVFFIEVDHIAATQVLVSVLGQLLGQLLTIDKGYHALHVVVLSVRQAVQRLQDGIDTRTDVTLEEVGLL